MNTTVTSSLPARLLASALPTARGIELAARMRATDTSLMLQWAPRTVNTEADALTNADFAGFAPELRRRLDFGKHKWMVLDSLMEQGRNFMAERERLRAGRAR